MIRLFNIIVAILFLGIVGFIAYSNIRDWNSLEVIYQFKDDGRVYGLYPSDRVSKPYPPSPPLRKEGAKGEFQEMVSSPVYIDVRYWQHFRHALVEIEYEKDPEVDFQIGYKVGKGFEWSLFDVATSIPPLSSPPSQGGDNKSAPPPYEGGDKGVVVLDIPLVGEYVSRNNVHRWILSSNNVQSLNKAIRIYGIKFTFTK